MSRVLPIGRCCQSLSCTSPINSMERVMASLVRPVASIATHLGRKSARGFDIYPGRPSMTWFMCKFVGGSARASIAPLLLQAWTSSGPCILRSGRQSSALCPLVRRLSMFVPGHGMSVGRSIAGAHITIRRAWHAPDEKDAAAQPSSNEAKKGLASGHAASTLVRSKVKSAFSFSAASLRVFGVSVAVGGMAYATYWGISFMMALSPSLVAKVFYSLGLLSSAGVAVGVRRVKKRVILDPRDAVRHLSEYAVKSQRVAELLGRKDIIVSPMTSYTESGGYARFAPNNAGGTTRLERLLSTVWEASVVQPQVYVYAEPDKVCLVRACIHRNIHGKLVVTDRSYELLRR